MDFWDESFNDDGTIKWEDISANYSDYISWGEKDHMNKNIDNDFGKPVKFKGDSFGVKVSFEGDKDFYKKADIKEIDHMGELTVNADENIN